MMEKPDISAGLTFESTGISSRTYLVSMRETTGMAEGICDHKHWVCEVGCCSRPF